VIPGRLQSIGGTFQVTSDILSLAPEDRESDFLSPHMTRHGSEKRDHKCGNVSSTL
jgi:hypothetical protein